MLLEGKEGGREGAKEAEEEKMGEVWSNGSSPGRLRTTP